MSSFTAIRSAIETKLGTVSELAVVKDFHTLKTSGYPLATFEPSGHENSFLSNTDNFREYAFDIIIQQEMENVGRDDAIRILAATVDAVITAFDEDFSLGGVVQWCTPIPSNWGTTTENGAIMFATMTLVCNIEITVNP